MAETSMGKRIWCPHRDWMPGTEKEEGLRGCFFFVVVTKTRSAFACLKQQNCTSTGSCCFSHHHLPPCMGEHGVCDPSAALLHSVTCRDLIFFLRHLRFLSEWFPNLSIFTGLGIFHVYQPLISLVNISHYIITCVNYRYVVVWFCSV